MFFAKQETMMQTGHILIYWKKKPTDCIFRISYEEGFSFTDLQKMYAMLHEADISRFVSVADEKMKEYFRDTNLKRIRTAYGCTQAELAKRSGVNLRSVQMYEQRQKDINKASAEALYRLAKTITIM